MLNLIFARLTSGGNIIVNQSPKDQTTFVRQNEIESSDKRSPPGNTISRGGSVFYKDLLTVQQRLNFALEAAHLGIWELDLNTNRTVWTEEENRFFGFPTGTEEVDAGAVFNRVHPDDLPMVHEAIDKVIKFRGEAFSVTFRVISPSGAVKWILGKGRSLGETKSEINRIIGINIDITDMKNAEEGMKAALHFSEKVVNVYPAHIYVFNLQEQKFSFVNQAMASFHGSTREQMMQWNYSMVESKFHPDDRARIFEEQKQWINLKDGGVIRVEFRLFDKNGKMHWMDAQGIIFSRDHKTGEVREMLGAAVDISHLKAIQEELHSAKEEAERTSQLKSAFLANMSHEIRTPLGVVMGYSSLLSDPEISIEERKKFLDIITISGNQLSGVINDILDLSKVESGELKTEFLEFDLKKTLARVADPLKQKAREKGIEFILDVGMSVPDRVITDPLRFGQILQNVVDNAIKFTQAGKIQISIYQKISGQNTKNIFIEVRDTGIGISAEDHAKLFKPFSQVDFSMTRKFGGTGLGLALSKPLAVQLGGDLILKESRLNEGSTFVISIQNQNTSSVSTREETEPIQQVPVGKAPAAGRLKDTKVLVVDDSEENRVLVTRLLSKEMADVDVASNGAEAVQKILGDGYDVILMDLQMPVMDGYTATENLRKNGFKKPIIALTAHALHEMQAKSLNVGCNDHISKPINRKELVEKIWFHTHPTAK